MHVEDLMTRGLVTVSPDTTVQVAARLLADHGFTALPVVEEGRLVGIVGETDVLRAGSTTTPRPAPSPPRPRRPHLCSSRTS